MSEKRPSFLRMPGQVHDSSARERRREFEVMDLNGEELIKELVPSKIDLEGDERTAESYAVASFVIEKFWDYLKDKLSTQEVELNQSPEGDTSAKRFVSALNEAVDSYRDEFFDDFRDSLKGKQDEDISKTDALTLRYFQMKKEETGRLGFPSMKDLVTMVGRMGDVVPKVYERDIGHPPSDEELFKALEHPSLKRLFMEMMTNSRSVVNTILIRLEGGKDTNLDDYTREFDPKYFKMEESNGNKHVVFRPEVTRWFRDVWAQVAENRANEGIVSPKALQCPVLYTGKFVEMYDWVAREFQEFYKAEKDKSPKTESQG